MQLSTGYWSFALLLKKPKSGLALLDILYLELLARVCRPTPTTEKWSYLE
jgi:hypothetical protein